SNESSSWLFAKKMPKATLDSLWGSLEGKFNKFVAGDNADETSDSQEVVGPFSHFNTTMRSTPDQAEVRQRRSSTPGVNGHADARAVNGYHSNAFSPVSFDGQTSISPVPEGQSFSTDNGYSAVDHQGQNTNLYS
ncbi:18587_t:CDS:2, partial [Acaulospora morrowiae]